MGFIINLKSVSDNIFPKAKALSTNSIEESLIFDKGNKMFL